MSSRETTNSVPSPTTIIQVGRTCDTPSREIPITQTDPGFDVVDRTYPHALTRENEALNISDRMSNIGSDLPSEHSEPGISDSKEFNKILKKVHPQTFSGKPSKGYLPWKNYIKSEVKSLVLSLDQWYELLYHRTTGEAQTIVKEFGTDVAERPMKNIIASLWKALDRLFLPKSNPSQDLLNDLLVGPPVSQKNFDRLKDFSLKFERLVSFSCDNSELSLIYDQDSTLNGLCRRLDETLQRTWLRKIDELEYSQGKVSLRDFNKWICASFEEEQNLSICMLRNLNRRTALQGRHLDRPIHFRPIPSTQ